MLLVTDSSSAALADRYDEIPYDAKAHSATHPGRMASVAAFVGHKAPRVPCCSVLEVGCSDGSNLIPMAVSIPAGRFVGCDLSRRAIDRGRATVEALGLSNVTLVESDLAVLSPAEREFDLIVAHGVYSWVPPPVRDALFALAADRLAPDGILYVSYNVLPGCRVRQAAWDALHHHVDRIEHPRARLEAARRFANLLADGGPATAESDQAVRAEFRAIARRSDSELCHDDLAVPNEPVLFAAFAEHAARHGLRYLAEAELHTSTTAGLSNDVQAQLSTLDPLGREQYLDFVRLRRFRQSLLVRRDAPIDATDAMARVRAMHVSATLDLSHAAETGGVHKLARKLDPAGGGGGPVRKLLDGLAASQPATFEVASLPDRFDLRALSRPIEAVLAEAYRAGIVELHVHPPAVAVQPSGRPVASPLARRQAAAGNEVTTLLHRQVVVADSNALKLLPLVDGTRDRAALAQATRQVAIDIEPSHAEDFVDYALAKFARLGLLMADPPAA
jgi:SAM-dependent methyltransferase